MRKYLLTPLITLLFVACGSSSSSSDSSYTSSNTQTANTTDSSTTGIDASTNNSALTTKLKIAVNNTGVMIKKSFDDYVLQVVTSKVLAESNEISKGTIAVYGTINSHATESLLKINTNYVKSDIYVGVFKNEVLVGKSATFSVDSDDAINFGEITIN